MSSARHKQVVPHAFRRRLVRLVLPAAAATVVTGGVVGIAVGAGNGHPDAARAASDAAAAASPLTVDLDAGQRAADPARAAALGTRVGSVSRSAKRVTLQPKPVVKDREYMTTDLNLWAVPNELGKPLDVLDQGDTVALTGVVKSGFAQILHDGQVRWVNDAYLTDEKPVAATGAGADGTAATAATAAAGVSSAPCADGSGTESGLTSSAVRLFRAVCNAFPALTTYGGYDNHGEHSSGRAIDFMISDPSLGQAVADWARSHASELGLFDVLWAQHIWTPVRSSEGWRSMSDRGSATANHFDHVHISVN
ncbi:MAG: hypothetical protein ABIQ59_18675 [Nocardioidaceae bacterium]